MDVFSRTENEGVVLWTGNPTCQRAHDAILKWLGDTCGNFRTTVRRDDNILRGNLGESIAFCVAIWNGYEGWYPFPVNAYRPFNPSSGIDIDIVWVFFAERRRGDKAVLQEVKATGEPSLNYANNLINDYEKLFGTDVNLTLQTRFQALKNQLEFTLKKPDLARRLAELPGKSPGTSPRIGLLPTLVHERNGTDPYPKMIAIRETLIGEGWSPDILEAWAIGLESLNDRLVRLATGRR
jgi:hypothetical protein